MMHSSLSRLLVRLLLNVDLRWTYCFKTINVSIDWVVIQYLISLWEKNIFSRKYTKECFCFVCFYNCEQRKWITLMINFYKICNRQHLNFVPGLYTRSTMNGIGFVFNNQTVLILLLLVKTVCGIDLLSFNNLLCCILNPINRLLINRRRKMSHGTCRDHFIRSRMSHGDHVRF